MKHSLLPVTIIFFLISFFFFFSLTTRPILAQVTIWEEDFSAYPNGTQNAIGKWETDFTDCDGVGSFGVLNGKFEVTAYEGAPCCSPAGGANYNLLKTEQLDISGYCDVSFSIMLTSSGNSPECESGGPFFMCSANNQIDNFHDQIVIEYNLDGGSTIQAHYVCGSIGLGTFVSPALNGNALEIRILPANKFGSETYIIDDIIVRGLKATEVALSIPQDSFLADEQSVNLSTVQSGVTGSWSGPGVTNGSVFNPRIVGQGTFDLTFNPDAGQCVTPSYATVVVLPPNPAQIPDLVSYQAVIRDANNVILRNKSIGLRLSILRDSSTSPMPIYSETHTLMTNVNGLISTEIGSGFAQNGKLSEIQWGDGIYFIKMEIDVNGGTNYGIIGVTQVLSVPYSLYSKKSDSSTVSLFSNLSVYSEFSDSSKIARTAQTSMTSGYSDSSGLASYSDTSNFSTYSKNATISDSSRTIRVEISSTGDTLFLGNDKFIIIPGLSEANSPSFPNGFVHCNPDSPTIVVPIISGTGRTWMDRNLGASRVAQMNNDSLAYGDLYQWGRFADGHQCRNSDTINTNASTAMPSLGNLWDGKFISEDSLSFDWLENPDVNLWQGLDGVNNPCPEGFRIPTDAEWDVERLSWSQNNSIGAFTSILKFPNSGDRLFSISSPFPIGSYGGYWSSSTLGSNSGCLYFFNDNANQYQTYRVVGLSIRCIKD